MPIEKPHEVRHPSVVNVSVCMIQSPVIRILAEIGSHIFMHLLLKINAKFPVSTNYNISAYAPV
jgi:hypothetical protein